MSRIMYRQCSYPEGLPAKKVMIFQLKVLILLKEVMIHLLGRFTIFLSLLFFSVIKNCREKLQYSIFHAQNARCYPVRLIGKREPLQVLQLHHESHSSDDDQLFLPNSF